MLNLLCTKPRGIETGVEVSTPSPTTALDALVGVAVVPDICKHSFVTLQVGGLGGGNRVDGLERTRTFDLNPPDLDVSIRLSNFLINLFNSVMTKLSYKQAHEKCIYLYTHTN